MTVGKLKKADIGRYLAFKLEPLGGPEQPDLTCMRPGCEAKAQYMLGSVVPFEASHDGLRYQGEWICETHYRALWIVARQINRMSPASRRLNITDPSKTNE